MTYRDCGFENATVTMIGLQNTRHMTLNKNMSAPVNSCVFSELMLAAKPFTVAVVSVHIFLIYLCQEIEASTKAIYTKPLHVEDESLVYFEILEPLSLRYIYIGRPARNFGVNFNQSYSSVELFIGEPTEGCSKLLNSNIIRGNSVILLRGKCSFLSKAVVAEEAGALFAIIADDDPGSTTTRVDMVHDDTGRKVGIPALFIGGKDGSMIMKEIQNTQYKFALLNVPVNLTAIPFHKRNHPPWTII